MLAASENANGRFLHHDGMLLIYDDLLFDNLLDHDLFFDHDLLLDDGSLLDDFLLDHGRLGRDTLDGGSGGWECCGDGKDEGEEEG